MPDPMLQLRACSVSEAVDLLGDRYSIPIIRELLYGNGRFSELAILTGAPRTLLSERLKRLEERGIVVSKAYSLHPPRKSYALSPAGMELLPVLIAFKEWGDRHCKVQGQQLEFGHSCGKPLLTEVSCKACKKPVSFSDLRILQGKLDGRYTPLK